MDVPETTAAPAPGTASGTVSGAVPARRAGMTTRWAILGTGVVSHKFVFGMRGLGASARVVSVASRDPRRAAAFARRFGIARAAEDYAAAVSGADVDAVYVATPPSEHEAHALLAIAAGKAVLIEKPFALDAGAARRIAAAASHAGVFCMEAMWTRFLPLLAEARSRLARGDLGEIRALHGSFMGSDQVNPAASLFDPARGGGALMHRGVYPLSLARHLLGPIAGVSAEGRIGSTGVDEDCTLVLHHDGGAISTIMASLRAPGPNSLMLSGTLGMLHLEAPVFRPHRMRFTPVQPRGSQKDGQKTGQKTGHGSGGGRLEALRESALAQGLNQRLPQGLRDGLFGLFGRGGQLIRRPYSGNGYHYEAAEVARCLALDALQSPLMPLAESLEIMDVIDRARAGFARAGFT